MPHLFLMLLLSWLMPKQAEQVLPDKKVLQDGIAHKYYLSTFSKDNLQQYATIQYRTFQLAGKDTLIQQSFNPAFELTAYQVLEITEDGLNLVKDAFLFRGDTVFYDIEKENQLLKFSDVPAYSRTSFSLDMGYKREVFQETKMTSDTSILNKPGKVYSRSRRFINHNSNGEIDTVFTTIEDIYLEGLGLWSYAGEDADQRFRLELIEQMTMEEFKGRSQHGIHRIGYIDFDNTLDKDQPFNLCGEQKDIADYYNGQLDRARFKGGKRVTWQYVQERLDPELLGEASGYLTLRFVINCEGQAGRFTTDEADLDFQPKKFKSALINHFYNILQSNKDWKACIIKGEARDAYTYISFKLKDGELVEILP
ncbi:MAG: hypothetical protein KDC24_13085 [Saprospiraceae bacterium]|nr:hypothetical protein [Saprospiraceae bacterium]